MRPPRGGQSASVTCMPIGSDLKGRSRRRTSPFRRTAWAWVPAGAKGAREAEDLDCVSPRSSSMSARRSVIRRGVMAAR
jgi:hypothetical protein